MITLRPKFGCQVTVVCASVTTDVASSYKKSMTSTLRAAKEDRSISDARSCVI